MDTEPLSIKTSFLALYMQRKLDIPELAQKTDVRQSTVRLMLNHQPVKRRDASLILAELSTFYQHSYTLDTVDIPVLPLFSEIYAAANIPAKELADNAGVTENVVILMVKGNRILQEYAVKVLSALSAITQQSYTLENTDVNLLCIEQKHRSSVTRLMAQIEEENTAAQRALNGFTQGTARHPFITQRMENIGRLGTELGNIIGQEEAFEIGVHVIFLRERIASKDGF